MHYVNININRRLQILKIEVDNRKSNLGEENFVRTNRNTWANHLDHDEWCGLSGKGNMFSL